VLVLGGAAGAAPDAGAGSAGVAQRAAVDAARSVAAAVAPKPQPRARVRALTVKRRVLARRGRMRVRIRYGAVGGVRVMVRVRRPGGRRISPFVRRRLVRFRNPGRRTVKLRLTRFGRRLARSPKRACATLRVTVIGRARLQVPRVNRARFSPPTRSRKPRLSKKRQRVRPARGVVCGGGTGSPGPSPPGPIRAGAASADITPPIGTPMFAYTARSNLANPEGILQIIGDPNPDENLYAKTFVPSEGIHTRVRARALVIEQFGRKFALVQTDLGGLPYALTQEVLRRVADLGIERERLLLSATHTHSSTGPIWPADSAGYALLGGDAFEPRAFDLTADGIEESIRAADANLEPARLGTATAELRGASRNRAFDAFRRNPDVPGDEAGARAVSIDPNLTVIRVDAAAGHPIAAWSNFAVHPTSFGDDNLLFSGDNVATAERVAERGIAASAAAQGNAAPAARPPVNVWTNSSEGDISPDGGPDRDGSEALQYVPNSFASANMAGNRVGFGTLRAWQEAGKAMKDEVALDARQTFVSFDGTVADQQPVGPLQALGQGGITADDGTCNPLPVGIPGQNPKFPLIAGVGLVPSVNPVSVWRVDRLGVLGLPAEVTKQMGQRIRARLQQGSGGLVDRFALAGLSGGYVSYTSTPEEYDHCGYEGSFTLFGRQQGARWREAAASVLAALQSGEPATGAPEPLPLGFGIGNPGPVDLTPTAGQVVSEPPAAVNRHARATFSWRGGDPAVDAPRGGTFVTLQRLVGGNWVAVGSDDSERDTTALGADGVWTETWQFAECDPLGSYRFLVRGVADRGSGPEPYEAISQEFQLEHTPPLVPGTPTVAGGVAGVTATYADPGPDILVALPRRVRTGAATLRINGTDTQAELDPARLRFVAPASNGATVEVLSVEDGCGNSSP
jgi:neutral ceramidase